MTRKTMQDAMTQRFSPQALPEMTEAQRRFARTCFLNGVSAVLALIATNVRRNPDDNERCGRDVLAELECIADEAGEALTRSYARLDADIAIHKASKGLT